MHPQTLCQEVLSPSFFWLLKIFLFSIFYKSMISVQGVLPCFSPDELWSFLAPSIWNWPLLFGCGTAPLAPGAQLSMCAWPAQLLVQLKIDLGEVQGLEHGAGSETLMKWKGVCLTKKKKKKKNRSIKEQERIFCEPTYQVDHLYFISGLNMVDKFT